MAKKPCFFWGATGQARVLNEFISDFGYELRWLFDNDPRVSGTVHDVPILGGWDDFLKWTKDSNPKEIAFLVAIGGERGEDRLALQEKIASFGFIPLTVCHRTAYKANNAIMGVGSQMLIRSILCEDAKIGKACIINTGAQVDHECELGDGVHVMPGAIIAGCVKIGDFATIGSGAVILPHLTVGEGAVIGAGAVVTKDVRPYVVVVGIPAKPITMREKR